MIMKSEQNKRYSSSRRGVCSRSREAWEEGKGWIVAQWQYGDILS
jgi:hypothetical protein